MRIRWWARALLLPVLFLTAAGCGGADEVSAEDGDGGLTGVLIDVHREPG